MKNKPMNKARLNFCNSLGIDPFSPYTTSLLRACITHHKLCEHECNGCTREKLLFESWKDYDLSRIQQMEWVEKRKATVEARIEKLCTNLNLHCMFEGDPRGSTVKLSKTPFTMHKFGYLQSENEIGAAPWAWK